MNPGGPMTRVPSRILLATLVLGCADASAPPALIVPQLAIVAGDVQTDTVTRTLPVQLGAKLTDQASGAPLGNRVVSWLVVEGGGAVFAPVSQTGSDGVARQSWTLGPVAGRQRLVARYIDPETGEPVTLDTAQATGTPDVAAVVRGYSSQATNALPVGDSVWIWLAYFDAHAPCPTCLGNADPPCADGGSRDRADLVQWSTTDTTEAVTRGGQLRTGQVGTWVVSVGPTDDFPGDVVSVIASVATVRAAGGGCLADRGSGDRYELPAWSFNTR